ncbi:MAG: class I SAM-dependent methyltransferase [Planctomycetes bacterium]|nr:class I SAM-dependent methyltransferase [Planctomycetota bacterium]
MAEKWTNRVYAPRTSRLVWILPIVLLLFAATAGHTMGQEATAAAYIRALPPQEIADLATADRTDGYLNDPMAAVRKAAFSRAVPPASWKMIAFEENRAFTYAAAVVGPPESEMPSVRQVLFLKPATFIVEDQIDPAQMKESTLWILKRDKSSKAEGHRTRLTVDGGTLHSHVLNPEKGRIQGSRRVRFLNVFHFSKDADGGKSPDVELESVKGRLELAVTTEDHAYHISLPDDGTDAGTIAVADADGKILLERRVLPLGMLPSSAEGIRLVQRWDTAYHGDRRPGWDTGRPSSNLTKRVEDGTLKPGRAIVLGCGTGTNAIYLAKKGFDVTALDLAPTALVRAEKKAREAGVRVRWVLADVLAPPDLKPFDLIFDRGCYHGVRRHNAAGYVESVRRLSQEGSLVLILAGNANQPLPHSGPPRVKEEDIRADFAKRFDVRRLDEARFDSTNPQTEGPWAWSILLQRKAD